MNGSTEFRRTTLALALALSLAWLGGMPAGAQLIFASGSGGSVPDATSAGTNAVNADAGVFTSAIHLHNLGNVSYFTGITINNLSHTFVGDLNITLTHVDTGTSVTLLDRVRKSSATSDGTGPLDYGSDSAVNGDFTFVTDLSSQYNSNDSLWNAVALSSDVLGGTYAASGNDFTGIESTSYVPTDLNVFAGESMNGTWDLTISDESIFDTGTLDGWQIQGMLVPVPEPSVAAMVITGGVVCLLVGRWRKKV